MSRKTTVQTRKAPIDGRPGERIREARLRRGWTQAELAGDRYTASYVSALEKGATRASMAALDYLAGRLDLPVDYFVRDPRPAWERMDADLLLASAQWTAALDAYTSLLDRPMPEVERALVLRGRAEAFCYLHRGGDALADASAARPILAAAGLAVDAAYATYWLAYAHYQLDNTEEARALIQQLLADVRAGLSVQGDFELRLLTALASIDGADGRYRQALTYLEEGRRLADLLDDRRRAAFLFSLAQGYARAGDHEAALRSGGAALTLYGAVDAEREVASLRNSLALTHLELGTVSHARSLAEEAQGDAERLDDDRLRAHVLDTRARIAVASDEADEAIRLSGEALALATRIDYPRVRADALLTRARANRLADDATAAEADFAAAAEILRAQGARARLRAALRDWAQLLVAQERHSEAVVLLTEAVAD
jgi:transcriptional regulator with XRE-family HTH domain